MDKEENNIERDSDDASKDAEPKTENTPEKSESEKTASHEDDKIDDLNKMAYKKDTRKDSRDPKETVSTKANTIDKVKKRRILSKLAFSIVLMFAAVAMLIAYNSQWKFRLKKEHHQPPVPKKETLQFHPTQFSDSVPLKCLNHQLSLKFFPPIWISQCSVPPRYLIP